MNATMNTSGLPPYTDPEDAAVFLECNLETVESLTADGQLHRFWLEGDLRAPCIPWTDVLSVRRRLTPSTGRWTPC